MSARGGVPFVDLDACEPDAALVARVPETLLRRKRMLPVRREGDAVVVATTTPDDVQTLDALSRALGVAVRPALADARALDATIERALQSAARPRATAAARGPRPEGAEGDAVALLDELLREAIQRRASDVHVEPLPSEVRVRYRVDGVLLVRRPALPSSVANALLSRVKVLAGLDIAERRAPQDGGFSWAPAPDARVIDLRVATAPTRDGERATIRLLGLETDALRLGTLGWDAERLATLTRLIERPHGMILTTGPTGSGKSTTLYAILRELDHAALNVISVEDPVEYVIPGIAQLQVDTAGKVTFASALRSLLRHDPDVLMVGEIRDGETADLAVKASMTGHLVLSTLHTNTAIGAIARLVDLGVQPFLLADVLTAVIAQRLVRKLCTNCKRARAATEAEERIAGTKVIHEAVGCAACASTGYRGRTGLFELVPVDRELAELVTRGASEGELTAKARERGARSLRADGLARVREGVTTLDEVLAATVED